MIQMYSASFCLQVCLNHILSSTDFTILTGIVLDASNADRPETWRFQIHHAWWGAPHVTDLADPKLRLQFFKERSSRLCEPFSTAAAALADDTVLPIDRGQQWSPISWDNHDGAITIAGDAAHSMLPSE